MDDDQISILRKGVAFGTPYPDPLVLFDTQKCEDEYTVYQQGLYIGRIDGNKLYLNFEGKSRNTMITSIRSQQIVHICGYHQVAIICWYQEVLEALQEIPVLLFLRIFKN